MVFCLNNEGFLSWQEVGVGRERTCGHVQLPSDAYLFLTNLRAAEFMQ